jgi:4-coumarate--CoA ligase
LAKEIQKTVSKRLNISEVRQGYGLTETTLAVLRSPHTGKIKSGSVGVVVPGVSGRNFPIIRTYNAHLILKHNQYPLLS